MTRKSAVSDVFYFFKTTVKNDRLLLQKSAKNYDCQAKNYNSFDLSTKKVYIGIGQMADYNKNKTNVIL